MILLFYFLILLILNLKSKSVAIIFILIQIISLSGIYFIGHEYTRDPFLELFNTTITAIILTLIIAPWIKINNIKEIYFVNALKLRRITNFLLIISCFTFIILLLGAILVHSLFGDNIDFFKASAEVKEDFWYNVFPLGARFFTLASYLQNFSYFLIPLHFYYLGKKKNLQAALCFVFSLNPILFGLTYFSRSVFTHYALLYFSFLFLLYGTFDLKIKKYIKIFVIIMVITFSSYFIYVSNQRFINYEGNNPYNSVIESNILYSYIDYSSQWYFNSLYVLDSYDFKTFKGQITLEPVLFLLRQYNIIDGGSDNILNLRQKLWPRHWDKFNGIVAYSIYDYGYAFTMILSLFYYYVVRRLKPKENRMPLLNLFYLILLIQFPLMAIFYSTASIILIPFLLLIPIYLYLRTPVKYACHDSGSRRKQGFA